MNKCRRRKQRARRRDRAWRARVKLYPWQQNMLECLLKTPRPWLFLWPQRSGKTRVSALWVELRKSGNWILPND